MIRQNASGAFWSSDFHNVIVRDFEKARLIAKGELTVKDLLESVKFYSENRVKIAKSLKDIDSFVNEINALPENMIISFDTETTSLDPMVKHAKLLCIQFGWRQPGVGEVARVIHLWHRENNSFDPQKAWDKLVPLLTGNRMKCGHNGKFDILYIYFTTGTRVKNLAFDTMLAMHSLDSGTQGCYGLKVAVTDLLPHTGLSGYEGLLPGLTKKVDITDVDPEQDSEESTTETNDE
jgi:DNA polymerase I-like protein with 3'-5' exonuclease and polymerase domains